MCSHSPPFVHPVRSAAAAGFQAAEDDLKNGKYYLKVLLFQDLDTKLFFAFSRRICPSSGDFGWGLTSSMGFRARWSARIYSILSSARDTMYFSGLCIIALIALTSGNGRDFKWGFLDVRKDHNYLCFYPVALQCKLGALRIFSSAYSRSSWHINGSRFVASQRTWIVSTYRSVHFWIPTLKFNIAPTKNVFSVLRMLISCR